MPYIPALGDTILYPNAGPTGHLYIIISNASTSGTYLLVNFSSVPTNGGLYDKACLVSPGEHAFIVQPSFIAYKFARIELGTDLSSYVNGGSFQIRDPVSATLLTKIQNSLPVSRDCPIKYKNFLARVHP